MGNFVFVYLVHVEVEPSRTVPDCIATIVGNEMGFITDNTGGAQETLGVFLLFFHSRPFSSFSLSSRLVLLFHFTS